MSQHSGAWLVLPARAGEEAVLPPAALPVPRQACLGLARAVLAGVDDAEHWLGLCVGDDAVRAWLTESCGALGPDAASAVRPRGVPQGVLLHRLAASLVVGPPPAGVAEGGVAGEPTAEALLLAVAVERMVGHARLASDFASALEAARLEAARELAYGAGHEINNPLANIATRAQALLLEEREPERRRRLAAIVDQSFRARDMIGGLMVFARPPKPRIAEVDAADLLTGACEAVAPVATARGARIEIGPSIPGLVVAVDRSQIEEALRAIAMNAVEAVGAGGVVRLAVHAGHDADSCEITVIDDGDGMDEATVRRAFDPFFSGREAGRGAGLGLSKAWRFVESSGGSVALSSRPGAGTTVSVFLPRGATGRVCPASLE